MTDDLRHRIETARKEGQDAGQAPPRNNVLENTNLGVRVGTELAAAIIVGGVLGYALDFWLDTAPVLFIGVLMLGIVTGFVNVYRAVYGLRPLADPRELQKRKNAGKEGLEKSSEEP